MVNEKAEKTTQTCSEEKKGDQLWQLWRFEEEKPIEQQFKLKHVLALRAIRVPEVSVVRLLARQAPRLDRLAEVYGKEEEARAASVC